MPLKVKKSTSVKDCTIEMFLKIRSADTVISNKINPSNQVLEDAYYTFIRIR